MLAEAIHRFATKRPSHVAIVDTARSDTWSELDRRVDELSADLASRSVGAGVILLLDQSADSVALMAACDRAGIRALFVSALYGEDKARALLETSALSQVLCVRGGRVVELARAAPANESEPGGSEVLLLSSGTTGAPKLVRHTWSTLARAIRERAGSDADCWMLAYPVAHFAGLQVLAQAMLSGARLAIPADFGPSSAMDVLVTHRVTCLSCTPTYLRRLLLAAPATFWETTSLRQLTLGGEVATQQILDAARRALPEARVVHIYASTELGAAITVRDGREGFDAALIDGERFRVEDGQLHARRSETAMIGYVGANAADAWIATGDLVEVENGRARFTGRTSEIINVGGFKVNPLAVESVVREVEGVAEAWVVGQKSSITGNVVKAHVCLAPGADPQIVKQAIAKLCAARLPAHMVPRLFEITDRVDATISQKLIRRST